MAKHLDKLEALKAQIEANLNRKRDLIADTRRLEYREDGELLVDGAHHRISDVAHGQMCEWAGIGARYYDKLRVEAPALLAENLNYWFHNAEGKRRMLRTMMPDGEHNRPEAPLLRAFLSDRFKRMDHEDVADVAVPALLKHEGIAFDACEITDSRMYIKAWLPEVHALVRDNDKCYAGIIIGNSEIGQGQLKVEPLVRRDVCGNNLLLYSGVREKVDVGSLRMTHVGRAAPAGDAVYQMLRDETREAELKAQLMAVGDVVAGMLKPSYFKGIVDRLREAADDKVEGSPVKAIEVLAKRSGLRESEQEQVLEHFLGGKDKSRWGIINALTRAAQDAGNLDRRTELERMGGEVLDLPKKEWRDLALAA